MLSTVELIERKRDGLELDADSIGHLVAGIVDGRLCDAQIGALAMAIVLRGMTAAETHALTRAMRDSGRHLTWPDLPGPVLDKHSTGGVGDCVSLVLAPLIAACGGYVPMISGRGLGHTGGTLDKLAAIPGYRSHPGLDQMRACVRATGLAIVGADAGLAPADARLYAIRDITATVECLPLIVSSILAKKLAAGLDALVLDVKCGTGAGCRTLEQAERLASALLATARACGLASRALITDMNQPLADAVGNGLEVQAALRLLTGSATDSRLWTVTQALAEPLLMTTGLAADRSAASTRLHQALASGAAAERFAAMVATLGGPNDLIDHPERHLPAAPIQAPVFAHGSGRIRAIDTRAVGRIVVALGGGRQRPDQDIDPSVGLSAVLPIGAETGPDRPLAIVHARSLADWQRAAEALRAATTLGPMPARPDPEIIAILADPHDRSGRRATPDAGIARADASDIGADVVTAATANAADAA